MPDMSLERQIKRYTAYLRGWCQAFGEHQHLESSDDGIQWLLSDDQVGLILPKSIRKIVYREMLAHREDVPVLALSRSRFEVGAFSRAFHGEQDALGRLALMELLEADVQLYLYLTYHIVYPAGTRIVTLSRRSPMMIFYKEIQPMLVRAPY
ncbi:MAG: hypothetical protein JSW10_00680 [Pseudomonadota bacterium]|nr:MAG: hypothetical protein JSW10_00680 [Pseudomonadota bacterium]